MKFIIGLFFLLVGSYTSAQSSIIEIKTDSFGISLGGVSVQLLRDSDSVLLKSTVTDSLGYSRFIDIPQGSYRLKSSYVGYESQLSGLISISNKAEVRSFTIDLKPLQKKLDVVTVTASKPLFQKLDDRIIVNVSGSTLNSGSTAMEVLTRSPGVTVDQNDNISLRGKVGVIIMIDGKPSPMSESDLANYLKSLPSETIERIEIITNPLSKYEASGSAGIIDIRLKKDQRFGVNGTLAVSISQGKYSKYNQTLTFNYRNKYVNVFGNYTRNYRDQYNEYLSKRYFSDNGVAQGSYDQDDYIKFPIKGNTARFGMDYFPNKNTIIGIVANGNLFHVNRLNLDQSTAISAAGKADSSFNSSASSDDHYRNLLSNVNIKHSFPGGNSISADADYGIFSNTSQSSNYTLFYDAEKKQQHIPLQLSGSQSAQIDIKSGKIDYMKKFANEQELEAGVKTSTVTSINDARFFNTSTGTPVPDLTETNHYEYVESNKAAYLNVKAKFKNLNVQAGLRLEKTELDGKQDNGNFHFDSSYLKLFPTANINYTLKNEQTIGFSFSRRIDRPTYKQMNPFVHLLDVTTYLAGNPNLQPEFTWSYELNYSIKSTNVSVNYSQTSNRITLVTFPDPKLSNGNNKVNLQTAINIPDYRYAGITLTMPFTISRQFNIIGNGTFFRSSYNAFIENTLLNSITTGFTCTINNSLKFGKGFIVELNGEFNSADREGFIHGKSKWQLNAGLQTSILKNKGNLRLSATDLFLKYGDRGTNDVTGYHEVWSSTIDTRVITVSMNWRFGNNKISEARNRTTSSEEESKRAR